MYRPKVCPVCQHTKLEHTALTISLACKSCVQALQGWDERLYQTVFNVICKEYTGNTIPDFCEKHEDLNNTWDASNWYHHSAVRELRNISRPAENKSPDTGLWNTICPTCKSDAYIGLCNTECSNSQCKGEA